MAIVRIVLRILTYLLYALTVLAAYGGRFNTDIFTIPAVLVLVAGWLAVVTFIVAIVWLCFRRYITAALGIAALAAAWAPLSTITPLHTSKGASPDDKTFTLLSYNVIHGWDMQQDSLATTNKTFDYIAGCGADIVALEEVRYMSQGEVPHFTDSLRARLRRVYPYQAGTDLTDQKVLSKYPVRLLNARDYIDGDYDTERYSFYQVKVQGTPITMVVVHLYSYNFTDRDRNLVADIRGAESAKESLSDFKHSVYGKMRAGLKRRKRDARILREALDRIEGPLIVCGDFNDVPESYAYRLIRGADLHDAYSDTSFGPMYTYNKYALFFHLDQILYRGPLEALSVKRPRIPYSDHYPLLATFRIDEAR